MHPSNDSIGFDWSHQYLAYGDSLYGHSLTPLKDWDKESPDLSSRDDFERIISYDNFALGLSDKEFG